MNYKFKPTEDITALELAKVIVHLHLTIPEELFNSLDETDKRQYEEFNGFMGIPFNEED